MKAKFFRLFLLGFCLLIYGELSWSVPLKLSQDFNGSFGVTDAQFLFNSTGNRVMYSGIFAPDNFETLFAISPNGQNRTFLSEPLVPMGGVEQFSNTSDGKLVVYRAAKAGMNRVELFSVPVEGGAIKKLNVDLVLNGSVTDFQIAGNNIIYLADASIDEKFELFSVPANGSSADNLKLNAPLGPGDDVFPGYQLSPSRNHVVFQATSGLNIRLFSSPVTPETAGNATVLDPLGNASLFEITPNDEVVFTSNQNGPQVKLFSVPITGGTLTQLNGSLVVGGNVSSFHVTSDGSQVVYTADALINNVFELFHVSIEGGTVKKLNPPLVANGNVSDHLITPDGSRVVYVADALVNDVFELFSVPIEGGEAVKLNQSLVLGGDVSSGDVVITPDGSRVVYLADALVNDQTEIFSVPVTGGIPARLNQSLVAGGDVVMSFEVTPDSSQVVFIADAVVDDAFELFRAPIGGSEVVRLNDKLVNNGDVFDFQINFNGSRIAYRADQEIDSKRELYITPLVSLLSDYDDDGQNDILIRQGHKLKILAQDLNNTNQTRVKTINGKVKGRIILANDLNQDGKPDLVIKRGKKLTVSSVNSNLSLEQASVILPKLPKKEKFLASGRLKGFSAYISGKKRNIRLFVETTEVAQFQLPKKSKVLGIGLVNHVHHLIISKKQGKKRMIEAFPLIESDIKQFTFGTEAVNLGELPKGQKALSVIVSPRDIGAYATAKAGKNFFNLVLPLNNTGFIMGTGIKGKFVGPK